MAASAILLVDDDRDSCASLSDIISDLGDPVGVAYDGPTALERARRQPYGLALLDCKMPGINGVELSSHLKRLRTDTVGVLVTASAADATLRPGREALWRTGAPQGFFLFRLPGGVPPHRQAQQGHDKAGAFAVHGC
jgi:CheY-like chemotaxis protein